MGEVEKEVGSGFFGVLPLGPVMGSGRGSWWGGSNHTWRCLGLTVVEGMQGEVVAVVVGESAADEARGVDGTRFWDGGSVGDK